MDLIAVVSDWFIVVSVTAMNNPYSTSHSSWWSQHYFLKEFFHDRRFVLHNFRNRIIIKPEVMKIWLCSSLIMCVCERRSMMIIHRKSTNNPCDPSLKTHVFAEPLIIAQSLTSSSYPPDLTSFIFWFRSSELFPLIGFSDGDGGGSDSVGGDGGELLPKSKVGSDGGERLMLRCLLTM
ncbi:hypothetical protein PIB30_095919 [Stylosanthes scabra]|uniref:Uncharacterized protein n=1 Tax=Stylosanthes scabra TaxID=79078 RepID=A0ABU6XXI9_9FABA|nr:hypothetical protein [Stylosanthes scabra]